jgi:hypothetical protein
MNHLYHCSGTSISFEEINTEQLIKSMYPPTIIFPDGSAQPQGSSQASVFQRDPKVFQPAVPTNQNPAPQFQYTWKVDGVLKSQGNGSGYSQYTVDSTPLSVGTHTVAVTVQDITSMVKSPAAKDSAQGAFQWQLTVQECTTHDVTSYYTEDRDAWVVIWLGGAEQEVAGLCLDTHREIDTLDCHNRLVGSSNVVISSDCAACPMSGPDYVTGEPYGAYNPTCYGDYECVDTWEDYTFTCTDGFSSVAEVLYSTVCTCITY